MAVVAVIAGVSVASDSWLGVRVARDLIAGKRLRAGCVWTGGDGTEVERFLRQWLAQRRGGTLVKWDVGLDGGSAQIDLTTEAEKYRIALRLGADCSKSPEVRLVRPASDAGFPTATDLSVLAAGFPARKLRLEERDPISASGVPLSLAALFIMVAFLTFGLVATSSSQNAPRAAALPLTALVLVGLAAWPMLFLPLDTDAPVIRAAAVATNIFGDPFHPFLPFLLNRPVTWFSVEPWALRLVPLVFLGAETTLLMLAAKRDGGPFAAALAGIWFACEVRRRHGLWDLSDWDFAGTFLMALLILLQRPPTKAWRHTLVLVTLMAAGLASSWLMIVPAGVLVLCLGIEVMRGRSKLGPAVAVGIVFAALAKLSLGVFAAGSEVTPEIGVEDLWRQMYGETPAARALAMMLPIGLAVVWLARRHDSLVPRFVALSLLAVPAAVYVAHQRSHVAGGYYVGLVTPLLLYAAAVATASATERLADAARVSLHAARAWLPTVVRGSIAVALAVATVGGSAPGMLPDATEYLKALAHVSHGDDLPLYTNRTDLQRLLAFERARAGEGSLTLENTLWGPPDLRARVVVLERGACPPALGSAAAGFYVAYFGGPSAWPTCMESLASRCRDVVAPPPHSPRGAWLVLRCDSAGPPP